MLSERLSKLRLEKKLTHQQMADHLGITRQAYGYYESGKRDLDTNTLNKLADFFDVDSDYLLCRSNVRRKQSLDNDVYIAYLGGPPEEIDEEEAEYLKKELEMFRALKEKRQREREQEKDQKK